MTQGGNDLREIVWRNLPTQTFLANLRHLEDLTHELRLLQAGDRSGVVDVPPSLASTIDDILGSYDAPHAAAWRQLEEALEQGRERIDVMLSLPVAAVDAAKRLVELLEDADRLCREGKLMTLPATEEVVELRRWTCAELERQMLKGGEPVPYP